MCVCVCVCVCEYVSVEGGVFNSQYSMECFFHDNKKPWFVAIVQPSFSACKSLQHHQNLEKQSFFQANQSWILMTKYVLWQCSDQNEHFLLIWLYSWGIAKNTTTFFLLPLSQQKQVVNTALTYQHLLSQCECLQAVTHLHIQQLKSNILNHLELCVSVTLNDLFCQLPSPAIVSFHIYIYCAGLAQRASTQCTSPALKESAFPTHLGYLLENVS